MTMRAFVAAAALCVMGANCQAPVPTDQNQLGWLVGNTDVKIGTGTFIELYGDFQCPDTRDAWMYTFKQLDQWIVSTGAQATVRFVPFPLPYHYNAYRSALSAIAATRILKDVQGVDETDAFRAVANALLSPQQDHFQNGPTANLTDAQIYGDVIFPIVQKAAGVDAANKDAFMQAVNLRANDLQLRTAWKYACSRGVTGAPVFSINGVVSNDAASWSLAQWKDFISGN